MASRNIAQTLVLNLSGSGLSFIIFQHLEPEYAGFGSTTDHKPAALSISSLGKSMYCWIKEMFSETAWLCHFTLSAILAVISVIMVQSCDATVGVNFVTRVRKTGKYEISAECSSQLTLCRRLAIDRDHGSYTILS